MSIQFTCPYGCGRKFAGKHLQCSGPVRGAPSVFLPADKVIDLTRGMRGGLPVSADVPVVAVVKKYECPDCENAFPDLSKHILCRGAKRGEEAKPKIRLSQSPKIDYSKVVYWLNEFSVRVGDREYEFKGYEDLAEFFLTLEKGVIVHLNTEWTVELTKELRKRNLEPNVKTNVAYEVRGFFKCYNLRLYSLESLEDFEKVNTMIADITGMNLIEYWTVACVSYEFWSRLNKREGHKIQNLQGEDKDFAAAAYYGARVMAEPGKWCSSLADTIEQNAAPGLFKELLADPEADIQVQVDSSSMYPAAMRGIPGLEPYYPVGEHRRSMDGEEEFKRGKVGMYHVNFTRPKNLQIGILPMYIGKRLTWGTEVGTGNGVYTDVDLKLALKYKYTLEFTGECLVWDSTGNPFKYFVDTLYPLKAAETDKVKRSMLKEVLVCLGGKFGQKVQGTVETNQQKLVSHEEAYDLLMNQGIDCELIGDDWYRVDKIVVKKFNNKPNHLGCFLLSWTRRLMIRVYEAAEFRFNFSHTDSVRISVADYHKLVEQKLIGDKELGLMDLEYGLIYKREQADDTSYKLYVLKADGTLGVIRKGKKFKHETA